MWVDYDWLNLVHISCNKPYCSRYTNGCLPMLSSWYFSLHQTAFIGRYGLVRATRKVYRSFICEVSKAEAYRIIHHDRNFGK